MTGLSEQYLYPEIKWVISNGLRSFLKKSQKNVANLFEQLYNLTQLHPSFGSRLAWKLQVKIDRQCALKIYQ